MIAVTTDKSVEERMQVSFTELAALGLRMDDIVLAAAQAAQAAMVGQIEATDKKTVVLNSRWDGVHMPVPGGRLKDVQITQEGTRRVVGTTAPYARLQDLGSIKQNWPMERHNPGRFSQLARQIGPNGWLFYGKKRTHPGLKPRNFRKAAWDAGVAAMKQKIQEVISEATNK